MARYILEHHLWQHSTLREFLAGYWARAKRGPLPPFAAAKSWVDPVVDYGRWIVQCPRRGCGGAIVATEREPYFLCPDCGSPENDGQWYNVTFPREKKRIERVLLHRKDEGLQHWRKPETVAALKRDNRDNGLPDDEV